MLARPAQDEIHLIFAPLAVSPDLLSSLWKLLSRDERERAGLFYFEPPRNRFVAGRGFLRMILAACLEGDPSALEFVYGTHGKPGLATSKEISFNVSGSGDRALYAIGGGPELGADLEVIRPLEDMARIAERFFCPAEYLELLAVPEHARTKAFFDCWTRKEALVKAVGEGLSQPLDGFQVTLQPGHTAELVSIDGRPGSESEWSLYDVAPPTAPYAAALAVRRKSCNLRMWTFESACELCRFLTVDVPG